MATYYTNRKLNNLLEVSERNIVQVLVMAGYGYEMRSYNTYNGVTPIAEKWKKPSYAESDHVARRLEQPFGSTENVVKSERIIEQVHTPIMTEYNRISPVEYGVERSRWGAVPSAVDDRSTKVEEFITQVQTEVAQPNLVRPGLVSQGGRQWKPLDAHSTSPDYKHNSYPSSDPLLEGYSKVQTEVPRSPMTRPGLVTDGTRYPRDVYSPPPPPADYKSSHTPSEYGGRNNTWGRASSPVRDAEQNRSSVRPGFLSNISRRPEQLQPSQAPLAEYKRSSNSPPEEYRTENNPWVRKSQPGLLRNDNWHQTPNSTHQTAPTGYDSYNNYKGKEMDNAPGYNKYMPTEPSPQQPARSTWTRPVLGGWATTTTQVTPLTRPTNNIKEAVNYLAGALQQSSLTHTAPQQYYDTSGTPKMDHYSETIDSREAQSRYGSLSGSSRGRETYSTTIDSREALRKYGGAAV